MAVLLCDGHIGLKAALHHVLDTFDPLIDYQRGIFIKPNIVFAVKSRSGEITPPALVKALVTVLRERRTGVDIILGEGVAAGCDPQENFNTSGYTRLAQELNVPLLDLNKAERTKIAWKFGKLDLPTMALERTYINLPILKPSSACIISGALKNQKGLLLPAVKKQFHHHGLHEPVAELYNAVRPAVTIMDGSNYFGRHTLISGDNSGEIDAEVCRLLGIEEPEHVQLARSARLFTTGYSVTGDLISLKASVRRPVAKEYKSLGRLRLWSNPRACTGCRYIFRDLKQNLLKPRNLFGEVKLFALSLKGAEIVMGSNPQWRREHKTVICIGACTQRLAKEGGYIHIPGCPPTLSDLYKNLPTSTKSYAKKQSDEDSQSSSEQVI